MRRRTAATIALALSLVCAGCVGGVGSESGPSTTATRTPPHSPSPSGGDGASDSTPTPSGTPTQTYVAAKPPNRPTETATRNASTNRIINAKFVNTEKSRNGDGYSNFDILMLANTSMERIDPPYVEGDVEGEPYAIVLINGELLERTSYLEMKERGRYTIDVRPAGFPHNDIEPGKLRVKVLLMDQDSTHDDVYGSWSATIQYAK